MEAHLERLPAASAAPRQAIEGSPELPVGLTNKAEILEQLSRTHFDGDIRSLSDYIADGPESNKLLTDYESMLTFVRIVKSHELNNSSYLPVLNSLEQDVERCLNLSQQGVRSGLSEANMGVLMNVYNSLHEHQEITQDTRASMSGILDQGRNAVAGAVTQLRDNASTLSRNQVTAMYGALFLGVLYTYTSGTETAKSIREFINKAVIGGIAGYTLNAGVRLITGDSIFGNIGRLNRRNNNEVTRYFGLDPDNPSHERIIEALLVSTVENERLADRTSFATMISAYNPDTEMLPDYIYSGIPEFNSPEARSALHDAVGLVYSKYGPDSALFKGNPEVAARWNHAMGNDSVSWKEGLFNLMALDPNRPDFHPTYTESAMDFVGSRFEAVASPVVTFSMEAFERIYRATPGAVLGLSEALRRLCPGGDEFNNFLDIELNSEVDLARLNGNYGRFAYAALHSNNANHIFTDSAGVSYTTVDLPSFTPNVVDETLYYGKLVTGYMQAYNRFKNQYPNDNHLSDHIDVLFGAYNEASGSYLLSFVYHPEGTPAEAVPVALDTDSQFDIDNFTPAERSYALAFYFTENLDATEEMINQAIASMPVSINTTAAKFEYLFDPRTRQNVMGEKFSEENWNFYHQLETVNQQVATQIRNASPAVAALFYSAIITKHSSFYLDTVIHDLPRDRALIMYRTQLEEYLRTFNSANVTGIDQFPVTSEAPQETRVGTRLESGQRSFEISTQRYFNSLCDLERTSPRDPVPYMTWSFEYESSSPNTGAIGLTSLEMVGNSVIFMGRGTTIKCDNDIVVNWYKNFTFRDENGLIVNNDRALTYNESQRTYTLNSDLYLRQSDNRSNFGKGAVVAGNLYYYMAS